MFEPAGCISARRRLMRRLITGGRESEMTVPAKHDQLTGSYYKNLIVHIHPHHLHKRVLAARLPRPSTASTHSG